MRERESEEGMLLDESIIQYKSKALWYTVSASSDHAWDIHHPPQKHVQLTKQQQMITPTR